MQNARENNAFSVVRRSFIFSFVYACQRDSENVRTNVFEIVSIDDDVYKSVNPLVFIRPV